MITIFNRCFVEGCWLQKKQGTRGYVSYRNYCLHMGTQHGYLERIMESDYRPEIQELQLALVEAGHGHKGIIGCRFSSCQGDKPIQFNRESSRELKLHYTNVHYKKYFPIDPKTRISPGFVKSGARVVCNECSAATGSTVYLQGEQSAVIGHLVVKHDTLREVLTSVKDVPETEDVIKDLYVDK